MANQGAATPGLFKRLPGLVAVVQDAAAKNAVLESLADPALARINFRVNGFVINPPMYARVKEKVEAGAIGVIFDGSMMNPRTGLPFCAYQPEKNLMGLGFNSSASDNRRALIIHEATHAACDVANYAAMTTVDSEIMGYVAQAIFLIAKLGTLPLQSDPIIAGSQLLAEIVLGGRALTPSDLISISQAILQHPDYIGKATQRVGYDGV